MGVMKRAYVNSILVGVTGVIVEVVAASILRYSQGWFLENGSDPFVISAVVLSSVFVGFVVILVSTILMSKISPLQEDMKGLQEDV